MHCSHLCMAAAVFTVVHFERHWVGTRSFQTGVVVPAARHRPPGAGLSHSARSFFYPPACSHSNILAVLPRSWREMKALRAKLVIHLLQPSWSFMWTRPRNFLWVIHLPAVPTVLFYASVVKLSNSFKFHLSVNPQNHCPAPSAMWRLALFSSFWKLPSKLNCQVWVMITFFFVLFFSADFSFHIWACGMQPADYYSCCCYGGITHCYLYHHTLDLRRSVFFSLVTECYCSYT